MSHLPFQQLRTEDVVFSDEVTDALGGGRAVVALETAVVGCGLPAPLNCEVARELEAEVRAAGAVPATICVADGRIRVGLTDSLLDRLAGGEARKTSTREIPVRLAERSLGATTVAATLWLARQAGIPVFATGGIGGVHPGPVPDISADLFELGRTPGYVVCSGPKTIVDAHATAEYLESLGVLTIGLGVDCLPWFYVAQSAAPVACRADSVAGVIPIARWHRRLGLPGAVLIAQPIPADQALPYSAVREWEEAAQADARAQGVSGAALTPFLLARLAELSNGRTLAANRALLRANAATAAKLAAALVAEPADV